MRLLSLIIICIIVILIFMTRKPENLKLYSETNTFKYSYYDDNAETRTNLIISSFPFVILLLDKLKPGSAENYRRNQKSPFEGELD